MSQQIDIIDIKTQLISEIVRILEIKHSEIVEINKEFQDLVTLNAESTESMIRACKVYDPGAFLAGAMITTSVLDIVRANLAERDAERERLEGGFRDVV
jgi:hypothetical protein